MVKSLVFIFVGGGIGSVFRFMVQKFSPSVLFYSIPAGTLLVNILGSLLIGAFYIISEKLSWSVEARLFLTTGLCGGFTTFSAFSYENMLLLRQEDYLSFGLSVFLNLFCCLGGVFAGVYLAEKLV